MIKPIYIGLTGISGWNVLKRTEARYMDIISNDQQLRRSLEYFSDNIDSKVTAADLVADYRMLNVALGAFGLEGDIGNKAFIRKVLESDLSDDKSLANRLSDKRYLRLAEAFGYGSSEPISNSSDEMVDSITSSFLRKEFERRVGEGDENFRLALNAQQEISNMSKRGASDKALWFEVLGNPPLRKVFEGAFGLGENFGKLSIDRQYSEITSRSKGKLGSENFSDIGQEKNIESIVRLFLLGSISADSFGVDRFKSALLLLST